MTTTFVSRPEHLLSVRAALSTNFAGTYANGPQGNGIGASLTASAAGVTTVDGTSLVQGDYVLLFGQTLPAQNGIYFVSVQGTASVATVLVRREDFNAPGQARLGAYLLAYTGTSFGGHPFVLTEPLPYNFGTDPINFLHA